jgi:rod shape-determining protein MreC
MATALLPLQRALQVPVALWTAAAATCSGLQQALAREGEAARSWRARAERAAAPSSWPPRTSACARCSTCARADGALAAWRPRCCTRRPTRIRARSSSTAAAAQGVALGAPVINEAGVLGQVTRVYPLSPRSPC